MKKRFTILLIGLLIVQAWPALAGSLDEGVKSLVNQLNVGILAQNKNKVAVIDFCDLEGEVSGFGKYVAEELSTQLAKAQLVSVVERTLLSKIIQEQAINLSPEFDETTAKQFGKISGADAIIAGMFTDLGNNVKINVRAIDTKTGQVITAATCEVTVDETVKKLLKRESPLPPVQPAPVVQEVPQPPKPVEQPVSKPQASEIIFSENFSKYEVGDPVPMWGEGLTVLKMGDGRKCLTTQMPGAHVAKIALDFPSDFSLEIEFVGKHSRGESINNGVNPTFVNTKGEPFKINMWGNAPSFQLPGNNYVKANPWNTEGVLKIVKKDNTVKIYWRDEFITSGSYNDLGNFNSFKFNLRAGDNVTNTVVKSLEGF